MRLIAGKGTVQTYIAYVDDAEYAQQLLRSMLLCAHGQDAHWVLVACAPRITHRVSKFVSNRSRENWRNKWADRLFQSCLPVLQAQGVQVTPMLAKAPLPELLESLLAEHGSSAQVIDMRRPKDAVSAQASTPVLRKLAGTLTSLGACWTALVSDVLAA